MKNITISPRKIYEELSKIVIGQEDVKRCLSNSVFMHIIKTYRYLMLEEGYGHKSNILIIGPTGCGKTHTIRALEEILPDIPVITINAPSVSKEGYVGNSLDSILEDWYFSTKGSAVNGIVFIDEVDKLCYSLGSSNSGDWNKTIQQSILSLIEGCYIRSSRVEIPTHNMMFILGGNFQELRSNLKEFNKPIGFKQDTVKSDMSNFHKELIKCGLIQELAGRISTICEVKQLNKKDLKDILLNDHGPYKNYIELFDIIKKKLKLSDYHLNKIVDTCMENNTGARGLQSALDRYLENKVFDLEEITFEFEKKRPD